MKHKVRDSCGTSGQVRPLKAQSGKGLIACPAESEQPGAEINYFQGQQGLSLQNLIPTIGQEILKLIIANQFIKQRDSFHKTTRIE
ncbi:hypothetical protein EJV22_11945 [Fictibacillus phosphorivorans]|nr:hypothetical protein [Fictibacillus phosphorivorans]